MPFTLSQLNGGGGRERMWLSQQSACPGFDPQAVIWKSWCMPVIPEAKGSEL